MLCSGRAHVLIIRSCVNGNFNPFSEGSWLLLHMNPRGASLQIAWNSVSQTVIKQSKSTLFRYMYIEIFEFVYTRIHRWNILWVWSVVRVVVDTVIYIVDISHQRSFNKEYRWFNHWKVFRFDKILMHHLLNFFCWRGLRDFQFWESPVCISLVIYNIKPKKNKITL